VKVSADKEQSLAQKPHDAPPAGIRCETMHAKHDQPWAAIIETTGQEGCDLIVMASHGSAGAAAIVLGSETNKVLTHSKIPVLVYH
jgi:nucleotide-binding universal stress UspA family protein